MLGTALDFSLTSSSGGAVLLGQTDQLKPQSLTLQYPQQQLGVVGRGGAFTTEYRFNFRATLSHDIEQQLEQQLDDLGRVGRPPVGCDLVRCQ